MTIQRDNFKLSDHGYKRLIEHGVIPADTPKYKAHRIVWKQIRNSREIITQTTIYYQLNDGTEFRFDPHNFIMITHIQQI